MRYSVFLNLLSIVLCCLIISGNFFAQEGWHQVQSGTTVKLNGMLNSVDFIGKIWVVGENGMMLVSKDFGSSFVQQNIPTTSDLYDMELLEMQNGGLCAVGKNGTIIRTTDVGESWTLSNTGVTTTLRGIMDGFAVGDSGTVLRTTDGGVNWIKQNQNLTVSKLNDVFNDFGSTLIAVGDNGTILRWHIPTNNWLLSPSGVTVNLKSIHRLTKIINGATHSLYIVCGDSGVILTTTDWGISWVRENTNINVTLNGIFETKEALSYEITWMCGDQGKIFSSINDGITWVAANSPVTSKLNAISFGTPHHGVPSVTGFIVGDGGVILRAFNQGIILTNNHSDMLTSGFVLFQNYPNPFNPNTKVKFEIAEMNFVQLKIYDMLGNEVAVLINEEKSAGEYEVEFSAIGGSASDGDVYSLPSGVYFYRLQAGTFTDTKKLVLLR